MILRYVLAMGVSFQTANHLPSGFWDGTKFRHHYGASPTTQGGMNDGAPLCLSEENCSGHGGGKGDRAHLGCGLEKRPPWPKHNEESYANPYERYQ